MARTRTQNRQYLQGFCYLEIVMGLALTALLLAGVVPLCTTYVQVWKTSHSRLELQQVGYCLLDMLAQDIRYGRKVRLINSQEIQFCDKRGILSGYRVEGGQLYKVLSNGVGQPLTGETAQGEYHIRVEAASQRGIFVQSSKNAIGEKAIHIHLQLRETYTDQTLILHTAIMPLESIWQSRSEE